MGDSGGGNGAPIETQTTVVESLQWTVTPKKPKKWKKSKSSYGKSNGAAAAGCTRTAASNEGGNGKEESEANKRKRIVWTPKLHSKFVKACNELGIEDAVPMKILQIMKTPGITRAQVASHLQQLQLLTNLQKYRDNLSKRRDEASIGESSVTALHHTLPAHLPTVPPSPQSPLETQDMRSLPQLGHVVQPLQKPSNGHSSSNHAVEESLLYDQQLHLLLVQPQCFAAPLLQIDPVARRELIVKEQPASSMMQQHTAAAASQHSPMPVVGVEQAAGAPVSASGEQNNHLELHAHQPSQAVNMLGGT
ncbi:hypothetical protein HU200_056752 [Digitaria exilis]|uniref:HTH myb-type domain-containing protein n=1 Tax=Digitaria exilis TaxID=1010633 RepID=A0A835ACC0_9POAL|nr:hypothetical protein HU200_056752 [Digitaria exilis]